MVETYRGFAKKHLKALIKSEGSASAAMKKLGKMWKEEKAKKGK